MSKNKKKHKKRINVLQINLKCSKILPKLMLYALKVVIKEEF